MNKKLLVLSSRILVSTLMLSSVAMAYSDKSNENTAPKLPVTTEKYPTLKELCKASLKMHKPFLVISEVMLNAFEDVSTQLDCRSEKLGIRVQRKIFGESLKVRSKHNIPVTGVKIFTGTENDLPTFDLIVKTAETELVQHGYMTLDTNGQPVYGYDNFNGFINPSDSVSGDPAKDYGTYYTETKTSMDSVCSLLPVGAYSNNGIDRLCQSPVTARTQVIGNEFGFMFRTPMYALSNLATHAPSNRSVEAEDSRVDFQKAFRELSALAEEVSRQPISDADAEAAIATAKTQISEQYESDSL
jgi:hypothetical protein